MGVGEESDHTHGSARISPAFLSILAESLEAVEARGVIYLPLSYPVPRIRIDKKGCNRL